MGKGLLTRHPLPARQEERHTQVVMRLDAPVADGERPAQRVDRLFRPAPVEERHPQRRVGRSIVWKTLRPGREKSDTVPPDAVLDEGGAGQDGAGQPGEEEKKPVPFT